MNDQTEINTSRTKPSKGRPRKYEDPKEGGRVASRKHRLKKKLEAQATAQKLAAEHQALLEEERLAKQRTFDANLAVLTPEDRAALKDRILEKEIDKDFLDTARRWRAGEPQSDDFDFVLAFGSAHLYYTEYSDTNDLEKFGVDTRPPNPAEFSTYFLLWVFDQLDEAQRNAKKVPFDFEDVAIALSCDEQDWRRWDGKKYHSHYRPSFSVHRRLCDYLATWHPELFAKQECFDPRLPASRHRSAQDAFKYNDDSDEAYRARLEQCRKDVELWATE